MLNQLRYFFTALAFFTRIPIPKWVGYEDHYLQQSKPYFTAVGVLVGSLAALAYYGLSLFLPASIAILLSMAVTIRVTGAFHEDGFADSCDAFGAGWSKEQILTIMKDSRLGTYGVVGIVLLLLLKFALLYELSKIDAMLVVITLIFAHASSRFMALLTAQILPYVQDLDASKSKPIADAKMSVGALLYSLFFVALSTAFDWRLLLLLPLQFLMLLYLNRFFKKKIQGYTGDCLGAVQQICEVLVYCTALIVM